MPDYDWRAGEAEFEEPDITMKEAADAVYQGHKEILELAERIKADYTARGYPDWIADRYAQRVTSEYFDALARNLRRIL